MLFCLIIYTNTRSPEALVCNSLILQSAVDSTTNFDGMDHSPNDFCVLFTFFIVDAMSAIAHVLVYNVNVG